MSSKDEPSAATNVAKPPRRRRKKRKMMNPTTVPEPTSISSLPYDLLLSCIARISRSYYPTLSLVSKNFRSIVASPELYQTRSRLGLTESCLYLYLRHPRVPGTNWFTLCRKPNRTITGNSSGNLFIPIPSPNFPPEESKSIVAVGSEIYKIGGYMRSSSRVSVLDCRSHTWHKAPRMRVKRRSPTAGLVDGKIYVAGGCKDVTSSNWIQVFDPKSQTWGNVTNPGTETRSDSQVSSLGIGGKFYLFGDECVVYNPKDARWDEIGVGMDMAYVVFFTYGVIGDMLFHWNDGVFKWYDCKASLWKKLNGVEGLPDFSHRGYCKIVDLGGKMALLWDDYGNSVGRLDRNVVWCAVVALERRDGDDMWGEVEWCDVVFTPDDDVDVSCPLYDMDVLSATV
ncbi:unnamed protein product [Microthlaspi erraticum]|uniref:F-box domain-containing protein n=1 Tax=Microthlaspi erraticum TaxID=1685480 RepID=A0A6D2I5C8_9BRAS|nr:unnamed protein product [Microthlaspi erraticum]